MCVLLRVCEYDCMGESGCVGVAALIDSITCVSVCGWVWV